MILLSTRRLFAAVVAILACCAAVRSSAQSPYTLAPAGGQPWTIAVQAESDTSCTAVVRDTAGRIVDGVRPADLHLSSPARQGRVVSVTPLQETKEAEFRVVLVIDNSASMLPRLERVFQDMDILMGELSNNIDISVVAFSDEPMLLNGQKLHVQASPFIRDLNKIKSIYTQAMRRNYTSRTFLYDAVYAASTLLKEKPVASGKTLKTYVILISDGKDIGSEVSSEKALQQVYSGGNAPVFHTIDYLTSSNTFLKALAEKTGGKYYAATHADDLAKIFATVAQTTYTAGYRVVFSWKQPATVAFTAVPARVVIERSVVNEGFPLLPYLFFEEQSAALPARYRILTAGETERFSIDSLPPDALGYYYHVLNIIGSRLRAHPQAVLRITGCNADTGPEQDNRALSRSRAEAVLHYLTGVWGIAPQRITVEVRDLPAVPSNVRSEAGVVENRRVELWSDTWDIIKPITFSRVSYTGFDADSTTVISAALSHVGRLRSYRWEIHSGAALLHSAAGTGADLRNNTLALSLPWGRLFREHTPQRTVRCTLHAVCDNGDTLVQTAELSLVVSSADELRGQTIARHRISLMLFPFNQHGIGPVHQAILREFVHPRLLPGSTVTVSGHTDTMGSEELNYRLSRERASTVGTALKNTCNCALHTLAMGPADPAFSNDLPEGRFYNRTVVITITTLVQ